MISCEPVRVETESMNFSEDSMFYKGVLASVPTHGFSLNFAY